MFVIGIGEIIVTIIFVIGAFILGFSEGTHYTLKRIFKCCDYDTYRNVMTNLKEDVNKEKEK